MSRRDYERIADILLTSRNKMCCCRSCREEVIDLIADRLAGYFKEDNERFDKKLFIEACTFKP